MSFTYGSPEYGRYFYGGRTYYISPDGCGACIFVYKSDGAIRSVYEIGRGEFLGVTFGHDECGCRAFNLIFADYVDIRKKDVIKIFVMDSDDCFYTGVIRSVPINGSTKKEWNYSGYGLNDYLQRINTEEQNYLVKNVDVIVGDLVDLLVSKSPINKNTYKISAIAVNVTEITFHYCSMKEAFGQLKKLADSDGNTYIYGVDKDGDFFFKPRVDNLKATLLIGKDGKYGIENYEPDDSTEARSKLYVLWKDGTFWNTITSLDPDIDIYEEKITAPDIAIADMPAWAAGVLAQKERDTRSVSIEWQIERNNPITLVGDGLIRIISNILAAEGVEITGTAYGAGTYGGGLYGGGPTYPGRDLDDTLEVREVEYTISSDGAKRTIQLGSMRPGLDREIRKLLNRIEDMQVSLGM